MSKSSLRTDVLAGDPALRARLEAVFGEETDPIELVDFRAARELTGIPYIVWEGDAQTFQFSFVSQGAEQILGYPCEAWTQSPTFWADTILHPEDARDAISYCAVATGQCRDHDFEYRALTRDGNLVRLHDVVKVVRGLRGLPVRLRGIMLALDRPETA